MHFVMSEQILHKNRAQDSLLIKIQAIIAGFEK